MKRTLIRYKTKPEMADRNAELIAAVFAELKAAKPDGVRYLSLRLDDDTLRPFRRDRGRRRQQRDARNWRRFKAFQSGIRERCVEPPLAARRYHRRQLSHAGRDGMSARKAE